MNTNPVQLLVVDDDDLDVMAVERALRTRQIANHVTRARDGQEGLSLLRGSDDSEALRSPYLVLLDLNMPRMNGFEFLEALRADPELRRTIVFMLTTSDDDRDRLRAYDLHVAGYVLKSDMEGFRKLVDMLAGYWQVVALP